MPETDYFYVYRLADSPRDRGYIICRAVELPAPPKNGPPPIPLIWSGQASDADDALDKAKTAEAKADKKAQAV